MSSYQTRHDRVVGSHGRCVACCNCLAQPGCCGTALGHKPGHGISIQTALVDQRMVEEDLVVAMAKDPRLTLLGESSTVLKRQSRRRPSGCPVANNRQACLRPRHERGRWRRHDRPTRMRSIVLFPTLSSKASNNRFNSMSRRRYMSMVSWACRTAVTHVVRGAETQREQIGHVVLPQLGPVNGCQGEIDNQCVSTRRALPAGPF